MYQYTEYYTSAWKGSTKFLKRAKFLERKYTPEIPRCSGSKREVSFKDIVSSVKISAHELWREKVEKMSSLQKYYFRKSVYCREDFYDNRKGSSLLAQARTDSLENFKHDLCRLCGENNETIEHIILDCNVLDRYRSTPSPPPDEFRHWTTNEILSWLIGFTVQDKKPDLEFVGRVKLILEKWQENIKLLSQKNKNIKPIHLLTSPSSSSPIGKIGQGFPLPPHSSPIITHCNQNKSVNVNCCIRENISIVNEHNYAVKEKINTENRSVHGNQEKKRACVVKEAEEDKSKNSTQQEVNRR
jgi:hypothetical protein